MKISNCNINNLLDTIDIISIVSNYLDVVKIGNYFFCKCPFHCDKTPSMCWFNGSKRFYCFGCKKSGDIIDFIMSLDNVSFIEAIKKLSMNFTIKSFNNKCDNYEINFDILKFNKDLSIFCHKNFLNDHICLFYLKSRFIKLTTCKLFRLGFYNHKYCSKKFKFHNKDEFYFLRKKYIFNNRLIFPIRDSVGQVIGFGGRCLNNSLPKYVNSQEDYFFKKKQCLYGIYEVLLYRNFSNGIIIVEGFFDVIGLFNFGINYVVGVLGTNFSKYHFNIINKYTKNFFFCFDGDEAGFNSYLKVINDMITFLTIDINFFFSILPSGYDPCSLILHEGVNKFQYRVLYKSLCICDFILYKLYDYYNIDNFFKERKFYLYYIKFFNFIKCIKYKFLLIYKLKKRMIFLKYSFIKKKKISNFSNLDNKFLAVLIVYLFKNPSFCDKINLNDIYFGIRDLDYKNLFIKIFIFLKLRYFNKKSFYFLKRIDFYYQFLSCLKFISNFNFYNMININNILIFFKYKSINQKFLLSLLKNNTILCKKTYYNFINHKKYFKFYYE